MKTAYKETYSLVDFPAGATVLDVGCGSGWFLGALARRGVKAIGVECNPDAVAACKDQGFDVITGVGEHLPVESNSCDGIICNLSLPFMDEREALAEWKRVLKPGGEVRTVYHGFGYALWVTVNAPFWQLKSYGAKMPLSTWVYWMTGKRLGTLCESTSHMRRQYQKLGFELLEVDESQRFLGQPVVIFHRLRKV